MVEKGLKYSFIWRIKNFSFWLLKKGEALSSPVFSPEIFRGSKWCIELYSKSAENNSDYMDCYLWREDDDNYGGSITTDFNIKITGSEGYILYEKTFDSIDFKPDDYCCRSMRINEVNDLMKKCSEDTITVTCDLFSKSKQLECIADTKVGKCKQSFCWNTRIPGETPEVKLIKFSDRLKFELSVTAPDNAINIVICSKTNRCSLNRFMICKMALLDLKGNEVNSQCATFTFDFENDKFEYPTFITKEQLMDNKSTYIENDCFTLWMEFSVSDGIEYSRILDSTNDNASNASIQDLQEDFLNMFLQKKHADLKFRVNNEIIAAHKSVLSARSPVFDAMFSQDMIESKTGIVDILDIDSKTMKSFLEYVYTGIVKNKDYAIAKELLTLADKYQVSSLKEECAEFLASSLSIRNVCDIFAISDLVTHEQL